MSSYLIQAATSSAATVTILGILGYLLFPRCKEFIWKVIEGDGEKYDRIRAASIKRNPEQVAHTVKEVLGEELTILKAVNKQTSENSTAITGMQKQLRDQGTILRELPTISSALKESSRALENVASMVKDVHTEVQDHGRRLERWDGYMDALREGVKWDGVTERLGGRRKKST